MSDFVDDVERGPNDPSLNNSQGSKIETALPYGEASGSIPGQAGSQSDVPEAEHARLQISRRILATEKRVPLRLQAVLYELSLVWAHADTSPAVLLVPTDVGPQGEPIYKPTAEPERWLQPPSQRTEVLVKALPGFQAFRQRLEAILDEHQSEWRRAVELSRDKVIAKRLAEIESEDPENRLLDWTDPYLRAIQQVLAESRLAPSTGPAPLVGPLAAALALEGYAAGIHEGSETYHLQLYVSRSTLGLQGFFDALAGPTSERRIGQGRIGD